MSCLEGITVCVSSSTETSEVYGFIYLWRDRKRRMYYLGSHVGREDDGYICSSRWMLNAFKKRPEDFRRRIIQRIIKRSLKDLRAAELYWLKMIKLEELGARYYNKVIASGGFDSEAAGLMGKLGGVSRMAKLTPQERSDFGKTGHKALVSKNPKALQEGRMKGVRKIFAETPHEFWVDNGKKAGAVSWKSRTSEERDTHLKTISSKGATALANRPVEERRASAAKAQRARKLKYGPSGLSPKFQKKPPKPKLTPQERSAQARYASSFVPREVLIETARIGRSHISKEQLQKNGRQVAACRTSEERKADAAAFFAKLTFEEKQVWAGRMNNVRTSEERSEARRLAHARKTPQERQEVARKSAATRHANAALKETT